ncbi:MAG: Wzz/FepE/Etk N-terminal domain-containing protein [Solirubrobacteraceae bacterium]
MIDDNPSTDEVDIRTLLRPLRRRWWLILGIVVVATVAVYYADGRKPKVYQATTSVYVNLADDAAGQFNTGASPVFIPSTNLLADLARLTQSSAVGVRLRKALNSPLSPRVLLSQVTVTPEVGADFVNITASGSNPFQVARLANAYAQAFVAVGKQQVAQRLAQLLQEATNGLASLKGRDPTILAQRAQLSSRISQLRSAVANLTGPEQQLSPALPSGIPVSPRPRRAALFAFILSLLAAVVLAYLLERLDRRIKQLDDLSGAYEMPLLGVIPHVNAPELVTAGCAALDPAIVESMRFLRVNLSLQALERPIRVLLITSAIPGEGKSTVARNLALAYREAGIDVVAVDADMRNPSLSRSFIARERGVVGLTSVLLGEAAVSDAVARIPVELPGLLLGNGAGDPSIGLLPSGGHAANPPAILGSSRMAEVLTELAAGHELVIIDSPPLLAVSDTLPLLSLVDGVMIVGRVGHTTRDAVRRARAALDRTPTARVVGLVADDERSVAEYGYVYGSSASLKPSRRTRKLARARA